LKFLHLSHNALRADYPNALQTRRQTITLIRDNLSLEKLEFIPNTHTSATPSRIYDADFNDVSFHRILPDVEPYKRSDTLLQKYLAGIFQDYWPDGGSDDHPVADARLIEWFVLGKLEW